MSVRPYLSIGGPSAEEVDAMFGDLRGRVPKVGVDDVVGEGGHTVLDQTAALGN